MIRKLFIFLPVFIFGCCISCKKDKTINLTTMDGFPDGVMGCSCYFAKNEADFKAQKFIYVDSYERNPGYISVDGELKKIDIENSDGKGYEVILDIEKEVQMGSELYHKEGTMTVVNERGAVTTTPIYGECGC